MSGCTCGAFDPATTRFACATTDECGPGFVCASGECVSSGAGGGSAGGSTAGGSTAGGSTAGGSTAGGSTAGGSSAGGSTAGGSTAGGAAGGSTAGGSTAGGSTAGGSTAGGSTAGGSTAGGSAGGSSAGGSTAGGSTAGGSTAGGSTAGGSTAGGSTAGGSTAGGSTAGGSTAGGSTAGGSTAGGSTAGGSTAGGSTAGGSTAGGSTAGGSTAGGSTAGGSTAGGSSSGGGFAGGFAGGAGAGSPVRLAFTTPPQTIYSGRCSGIATVQTVDGLGAVVPTTVPRSVTWSTGTISSTFYSDAMCMVVSPTTTIPVGTSSASTWFRSSSVGDAILSANSAGLVAATQMLTVRPAPVSLAITQPGGPYAAKSCVPVTLSALAQGGAPAALLTPEPVLVGVSPGLSVFTNPSCSTPMGPTATIPAGSSSVIIYVQVRAAGPLSLTAVASFGTAMATLNGLAAVRRGTCTLPSTAVSVNCFVPPPAPLPSRSLLVFQARAHDPMNDDPSRLETRCRLASPDIVCSRFRGGPAATITWQILELASDLFVQRATGAPCPGSQLPLTTPVDSSRSFVLASVSAGGANLNNDDLAVTRLVGGADAGWVSIEAAGGCEAWEYQVATFAGVTVTHGTVPGFGFTNMRSRNVILPTPASTNTVVLTQLEVLSSLPTNAPTCNLFARGLVTSPSGLTFTRAATAPAGDCDVHPSGDLSFQRIDFNATARVQQLTVSFVMGDVSRTAAITTVDPDRTLTFLGTQAVQGLALGEVGDSTLNNDELGPATATTELTNSTTVTLTRPTTEEDASFTLYVVEFAL
ncbi:MAG: hypothetical protein JNJ54_27645 [Myxococcaceae bacterium]|nr:hypothetical protein [Myxococcaceae bacterium]